MKVKWSGIAVVEGRGKINGSVASKNRAGAYFRTKVTPVNPRTTAQLTARGLLTTLSQTWRSLTQAQRDAWNAAVSDFSSTDVFGDLRNPTGKNLFTKLNINLLNAGQSTISAPPLPAEISGAIPLSLTISVGTPTYDLAHDPGAAGITMLVFATSGLSAGVSFVKSEFRLIGTFAADNISPENIETAYLAKFGAPAVGTKVFVQIVPINNTTGQAGSRAQVSTIVLA